MVSFQWSRSYGKSPPDRGGGDVRWALATAEMENVLSAEPRQADGYPDSIRWVGYNRILDFGLFTLIVQFSSSSLGVT